MNVKMYTWCGAADLFTANRKSVEITVNDYAIFSTRVQYWLMFFPSGSVFLRWLRCFIANGKAFDITCNRCST